MIIGGLSVNNNCKHKVKGVVDFFFFFFFFFLGLIVFMGCSLTC